MKTTVEKVITTCDVCSKTKENPIALSGFSAPIWRELYGNDLCYECYQTLADKALYNLLPQESIQKEITNMNTTNLGNFNALRC